MLLSDLNLQNIVDTVSRDPKFGEFRYALLASLAPNCLDVTEYLPEDENGTTRRSFAQFARQTEAINARQRDLKQMRLSTSAADSIASGGGVSRQTRQNQSLRRIEWQFSALQPAALRWQDLHVECLFRVGDQGCRSMCGENEVAGVSECATIDGYMTKVVDRLGGSQANVVSLARGPVGN